MGKIDIKAVAKSYSGDKDISTWKDFVKVIAKNQATAQEEAYDFNETFRCREMKDIAGTKYSFGLYNFSGFDVSQSTTVLFIPINLQTLNGTVSSFTLGLLQGNKIILKNENKVIGTQTAAVQDDTVVLRIDN
jgi:hypothetical protein